jgi:hypothetical protein
MNASQPARLEDLGPPLGFQEGQAQEHDHARAQIERMRDELFGELEGRIRENHLAACRRHALEQEVAPGEMSRDSVVDEIRGEHDVTGVAQDLDDRAAAGRRLPDMTR